ncbi:MAG: hypothetical protein M1834_007096 [Cirrosporium novae-zelandiae]|nr:MAG: hypothetical protein M1834_007096 [Cirrosporium novae-zelandiae]
MPFYEVTHVCPLLSDQQQQLASAITRIHTTRFVTPSIFVNVVFKDASRVISYIGGKKRAVNRITATVRSEGRSRESFTELTYELNSAWNNIVNDGKPGKGETELRVVAVFSGIAAALEAGFPVPKAGEDMEWMKANKAEFEKRAKEGDEEFGDLLEEMKIKHHL